MATHTVRWSLIRVLSAIALSIAALTFAARATAQAADPAATQTVRGVADDATAAAASQLVDRPLAHPGIDQVLVATEPVANGCPPVVSLDSIAGELNGTYKAGGKSDTVIDLDFPAAPASGGTLGPWLTALGDQLLLTLNLRLNDDQRTQYAELEQSKCSTQYCRIAMRQKTIYYLLGGK